MKYLFYACSGEGIVRYVCQLIGKYIDEPYAAPIETLLDDLSVIAFSDSAEELWGTLHFGRQVIPPAKIAEENFDKIFICSAMSYETIKKNLTDQYGVAADKIDCTAVKQSNYIRKQFVQYFAKRAEASGIEGNVAEGGVYRGAFAKVINKCFSNRTLHLFDTFEGFSPNDIVNDKKLAKSVNKHSHLGETCVEIVLNSLPYREKAIIHKGIFPETTKNVDDIFVFVSLDFDLYSPIKSGLEWFYPRMNRNGLILVHDYFNTNFDCMKAVDEFCEYYGLMPIPIGDGLSVAIICTSQVLP